MKAAHRRQFHRELILSRLQPPGAFPVVLVLDHMKPTFNIGKIIRTANAFGVREVHLVGIPIFHPKPCAGTLKHTRTRSYDTFAECHADLSKEGYRFLALEPGGDALLGAVSLPMKTAFIVGHEDRGLSFNPDEFSHVRRMRIAQFGAVQSLNASIAASVACFEYLRQRDFSPTVPLEGVPVVPSFAAVGLPN